jgi:uncharacterized protein YndB with AHSA1/START domain
MMARGSAVTEIERAPADVFAVLADVTKNAQWASASIDGHLTSPGPVGVGTTAREVTRFLGRRMETDSEVIEFIPGRRLAYIVRSASFPFAGAFDVVPEGAGSRVTATFEATPTGRFRLLGPIFIRLVARQFTRDLGSLKRRMEAHEM